MEYTGYLEVVAQGIVECGRKLRQAGLIPGCSGNISVRVSPTEVMSTPAGLDKSSLTPREMVVTDLGGQVLQGGYEPSSELKVHLGLYAVDSEIGAVVHAHTPYTRILGGWNSNWITEISRKLGAAEEWQGVTSVSYQKPGSQELADAIAEEFKKSLDHTLVVGGHGVVAVGISLTQAWHRVEMLEHLAMLGYKQLVLSQLRRLG